jgi:hypothetical protein
MDFTTMDIQTIAASRGSDGTGYLQSFLQEYTKIFKEKVNPSCPRCLNDYLTRYKNYYKEMANTCKYRLHAKYENIPLEFGSQILVNNGNITDEFAARLLEQKNGERYFALIPDPNAPAETEAPSKKKRKRIVRVKPDASKEPTGDATDISSVDS